jgi:hypothetical protein
LSVPVIYQEIGNLTLWGGGHSGQNVKTIHSKAKIKNINPFRGGGD